VKMCTENAAARIRDEDCDCSGGLAWSMDRAVLSGFPGVCTSALAAFGRVTFGNFLNRRKP
jgi:hypothetical protein